MTHQSHPIILRRSQFVTTVIMSVLVITSFVFSGIALETRGAQAQQQRIAQCQAQNRSDAVIKRVLLLAEDFKGHHHETKQDRADALRFYREAIALVHPIKC